MLLTAIMCSVGEGVIPLSQGLFPCDCPSPTRARQGSSNYFFTGVPDLEWDGRMPGANSLHN